jgi:hypothetical protein
MASEEPKVVRRKDARNFMEGGEHCRECVSTGLSKVTSCCTRRAASITSWRRARYPNPGRRAAHAT